MSQSDIGANAPQTRAAAAQPAGPAPMTSASTIIPGGF
jgi:hypothetical protein